MRVVHVLNAIEYSGAEIMLYQAAPIFNEQQIDTTLLACYKNPGQFEQPMREQGYIIDHIGTDGKIPFLKNFYKYFNANKFDVVHIHTEELYLWKVIILKLTGHNNIIRTFHNCWSFTGFLRFKRTLHRRLTTWLGVKNHAIGTAVQDNEARVFFNKTFIINNWIKLNTDILEKRTAVNLAKRAELGIDVDAFVVISIGGCSPIKNHAYIVNLIKDLNNKGLKICYLHAGTGVDEAAEKTLAKTIGVDAQVIFTGNRKDIPELLLLSDLYLMPSMFEGLSIALIEAMYYNGLVVVNDAPGLSNMIINNQTGYVIPVAERQDYINLILNIANKSIDVNPIKENARTFVAQNFSMEKNARELVEFYKLNTTFE